MDLWITFLGTAASVPSRARGTAATLVAHGSTRVLVDCGEGTQRQLLRSGAGLVDVDLILLTHLHGDHVLGLPGLVKTYALRGRERPVRIVGPAGLNRMPSRMGPLMRTPLPVEVHEAQSGVAIAALDGGRIEAFQTEHGVPSLGYALVEADRPGEFHPDAATALGVTPGPMFGSLQRGETLEVDGRAVRPGDVMGPPRPGRRVVFTGDTQPCAQTVLAAAGAQLLVHEATFLSADRDRARETRHSTAAEAAQVAQQAGVGLLVLTHVSSRYAPSDVKAEAEAVFAQVIVPRDFDQVHVPLPEAGAPVLHRAGGPGAHGTPADGERDPGGDVPH